jgi:hypothetical protein
MKTVTMILISLVSTSSFAAHKVGSFEVPNCNIVVPKATPAEVSNQLKEKGYLPTNGMEYQAFNTDRKLSGDFSSTIHSDLHADKNYSGQAYLEISSNITPGFASTKLSVGFVGHKDSPKFESSKNVLFPLAGWTSNYSLKNLPHCI